PHDDAALGRLVEAGGAVEDRGLARAVGTDERGDIAVPDIEGQIGHRDETAETHRQMLDAEKRLFLPARRRHQWPSPCETMSAPMRLVFLSAMEGVRLAMRPRGR